MSVEARLAVKVEHRYLPCARLPDGAVKVTAAPLPVPAARSASLVATPARSPRAASRWWSPLARARAATLRS
jgi:hypothetical protein